MLDFLQKLFDGTGFMAHGHCYLWEPAVLWLHIGSDLAIALAYFSIPAALFYFVRQRPEINFGGLFILFGIFILSCGANHLIDISEGFTFEIADDLPVFDTLKVPLQQVLRNLIQNAIKHHDRPDGHISLTARDTGDFHEFTVADDGGGIPRAMQESIFDVFTRGVTRDEVGSGMGLAIVRRTIERLGGTIRVDSKSGEGAAFSFTWPKTWRPTDRPKKEVA